MTLRIVALMLLSAGVGCDPSSMVEPVVYAGRGGMSPSTQFEMFRSSVDDSIRRELAGKKLGLHGEGPSWKEFWQGWYRDIRRVNDSTTAASEIDYIHQQRQQFGLPLYTA